MAKKDGVTEPKAAKSGGDAGKSVAGSELTVIHFSIPKTTARKLGRIKRWEDRSETKSLELTGRR